MDAFNKTWELTDLYREFHQNGLSNYETARYQLAVRNAKYTGDSAYFEYLGRKTPTMHQCQGCGCLIDCKDAVEKGVCKDCYAELGGFRDVYEEVFHD